jgi:hypothetical protein
MLSRKHSSACQKFSALFNFEQSTILSFSTIFAGAARNRFWPFGGRPKGQSQPSRRFSFFCKFPRGYSCSTTLKSELRTRNPPL